MTAFIDSHAHLADPAFDPDRDAVIDRALDAGAQAIVCIGESLDAAARAVAIAGSFDRSAALLGGDNEGVLKRAAGPQIVPLYGTEFRSTPMFFVQDDHDYYDNDDAYDEIVTFPPGSPQVRF